MIWGGGGGVKINSSPQNNFYIGNHICLCFAYVHLWDAPSVLERTCLSFSSIPILILRVQRTSRPSDLELDNSGFSFYLFAREAETS